MIRWLSLLLIAGLSPAAAFGYIHFPPMTVPKMCRESSAIRVLKVEKFDKDKGVLVFETTDYLKKPDGPLKAARHVFQSDAAEFKPLLAWLAAGKTAVMFDIERSDGRNTMGCGFVFIDEFCYSVDYNAKGEYWLIMRAELAMSAFFHGKVNELRTAVQNTLAGKEVNVPTKETTAKGTDKDRHDRINEMMIKNRK